MKVEDRSAIFRAAGASPRTRLPKVTGLAPGALTTGPTTNRQSTIDNRHLAIGNRQSRRGSALVLVMTILGILFVLGVAFLASMNFEADLIALETQRHRAESRVTAVVDQLGSTLRDGLMSAARTPFGDPSTALSPTAFADMPGVQNSTSAIEPHWDPGPDGILGNVDDKLVFSPCADVAALKHRPFTGPSLPRGFAIDTSLPNGAPMGQLPSGLNLRTCLDGPNKGQFCALPPDCLGYICEGPRVLDADGDGIVDSLQVDAKVLDFSDAQLAALSARLNPPTNPTGKVFVGIRVIPHGGLVNLNASHPNLIENVLDVPPLYPPGNPPHPEYGYFYHRPTQNQVAYSPLLEESTLRRRALLPPRTMPPSLLHGDPLLDPVKYPNGKADMQWQLFAPLPSGAASGKYESVFSHRFSPYSPDERFPGFPNYTYWAVRMEPFASAVASPGSPSVPLPDFDRRHLVTAVSHDDLLARGGRVPNPNTPGGDEDVLAKMTQANQTAWHPEYCPALLPFEFADYPQTIPNDCCPTEVGCKLNARKGRLQLSLPWLDDQIDAAYKLTDPTVKQCIADGRSQVECVKEALDRVVRLIHDAFFLLVRNAAHVTTLEGTPCASDADCTYANGKCGGNHLCTVATVPPAPPITFTDCRPTPTRPIPDLCSIPGSVCRSTDGVCTIQAPSWQDRPCTTNADCASGEFCLIPPGMMTGTCTDVWTYQTHSQALISRTAAALTANFLDYSDGDDVPTRIALRSFDFTRGVCAKGANTGRVCDTVADCGTGGVCAPPANAAGREFDFDPAATTRFEYVYGLERQGYITEVATLNDPGIPGPGGRPPSLKARAIEFFNPYAADINATGDYFLYEVNPALGLAGAHEIALTGTLTAGARPFTTFASGDDPPSIAQLVGPSPNGAQVDLTGANKLAFENGWILYLVRRYSYLPGEPSTNIVVDQFEVPVGGKVGKADASDPLAAYSRQRMVLANSPWTATVPKAGELIGASLGDWNTYVPIPPLQPPHPVEVNFADLGRISRPFKNPTNASDPRNGSFAFPTTGSLLMLMRHANRSLQDYTPPGGGNPVTQLAFITRLVDKNTVVDRTGGTIATIFAEDQIDNGRMPVFDPPVLGTDNNWYAAHHLAPYVTRRDAPGISGAPGNLDMLPWGQLAFDYFTALPLSNPGPYLGPDKNKVALPDSLPRVDMEGLRVHGRININAAPWKVLAGLPFVPMEKIPVAFKAEMRRVLGFVKETAANSLAPVPAELDVLDTQAGRIGNELAQAIVAYRELRPLPGGAANLTGNYDNGTPVGGTPPAPTIAYGRGWNFAAPVARRGTGFMTVGELANVRHLGAATLVPPPPPGFSKTFFRIDGGVIDPTQPNQANTQNFVDAVAGLVALGDWVTVRSQVFTVYGVLRGEEDQTIIDPDPNAPPTQAELRARDVDSRALRFQETIDRLPTFLGEPLPSRIGDRSLTRYTDAHND